MKISEIDALTYSLVNLFEGDDHSESEIYFQSTKLTRENIGVLGKRVAQITSDSGLVRMMARGWKTYAGAPRIALPRPSLGTMTLEDAMRGRRSTSTMGPGRFSGEPITLAELGSVLAFSYGPTRVIESPRAPGEKLYLRAAASGGGLYPLEIYPLVFNVDGCEPGVYHYSITEHALELVRPGPCQKGFIATTSYGDMASTASVMFVVTAVLARTLSKYLFRGLRFVLNDVGVLVQNFYLTGTALGLDTCAIGGFFDDEVGSLIEIDNVDEHVAICFAIGRKVREV